MITHSDVSSLADTYREYTTTSATERKLSLNTVHSSDFYLLNLPQFFFFLIFLGVLTIYIEEKTKAVWNAEEINNIKKEDLHEKSLKEDLLIAIFNLTVMKPNDKKTKERQTVTSCLKDDIHILNYNIHFYNSISFSCNEI